MSRVFFRVTESPYLDTPRSKETGILGSLRLLAKDRIASEKVEVFSPQAFIGSSIEGSGMPYRI
jgi:hypothetical protein